MRKRKLFLASLMLLSGFAIFAQQTTIWEAIDQETKALNHAISSQMHKKKQFRLHINTLNTTLQQLQGKTPYASKRTRIIHFPMPDGDKKAFEVYETPIMAPTLASRYPNIKSYTGRAVENPLVVIKFTLTDFGFHGMIFSPDGITSYINPKHKETHTYEVLSKKNWVGHKTFTCEVEDPIEAAEIHALKATAQHQHKAAIVNDGNLRTFRLALAATAEYTAYHANAAGVGLGTDEEKRAAALAAMTITMTRVNGIFERDLGLTMELVPNESIIFINPNTDGLSNDNGANLINEIQSVINANIGIANYDIGHVFSTGGGGIAALNSPCTSNKARGVTGLPNPVGDPFDIDFVAHEMGHQYGATHTYNNSCQGNRFANTAVEPGSGSTIMGYAGICTPNVQLNADAYFHAVSIQQMWENISSGSSTCAALSPTGNTAPTADAGNDYTLPIATPFVLEGEGNDADGDPLTYSWEQTDIQIAVQPPVSSSFGGPLFRSRSPTTSSDRYFPALSNIRSGINSAWEVLPEVARTLNFSLLVRDNHPNGGQTARDDMRIYVEDDSGPFIVNSQQTQETWEAGSVQTITWDTANTDIAPINATHVSIFLYTDTQFENAILLAENVLNDGSHNIVVPGGIATTTARIMVRPINNIFFSVNTADITITESEYTLNFISLEQISCQPNDAIFNFTYTSFLGFSDETTFTAVDVPEGLMVSFNPTSTMDNNTDVEVTVSNTDGVAEDDYTFTIRAASGPLVKDYEIALALYDDQFNALSLVAPADAATGVNLSTPLAWEAADFAQQYEVEIADIADFSSLVESATVFRTNYIPTNLQGDTTYYWRVRPVNDCGEGIFSDAFSYTTTQIDCRTFTNDTAVTISANGTPSITSSIIIPDDLPIHTIAVNLNINHTYVEDLSATLTSPSGTVVNLFSSLCGNGDNINATFSDEGALLFCGISPAISGTVRPAQPLETFRGASAQGEWILTINDAVNLDGGILNVFELDVCVNGVFPPDTDLDGVTDANDLCPDTVEGAIVDITGCPIFSLAPDNFLINTIGESCSNNNDGRITIMANEMFNYEATLTGSGINRSANFTEETRFDAIPAGSYMLCITVDGVPDYEQCYTIIIVEPESLSVQSKVNVAQKTVLVHLEGGALYNVALNGIITQTTDEEVVLALKEGINTLKVTTDKTCQGMYEEEIIIGNKVLAYPNPIKDEVLHIDVISNSKAGITVKIHSISGKLVYDNTFETENVPLLIPMDKLPPGVYLLKISGENIQEVQKIVKL